MKVIPVAKLRQNPTQALDEVERGATYIVTRHDREVARLVPPQPKATVTPEQFRELLRATPLAHDWAAEVREAAADFDGRDAWSQTS
ncbi:MAG: type II toxin-antitoxin system Phd/YefM family antitoxin [Truepera sp.]|jgi:prevent-host-death family protein|nr:type II toxin-antitoxin system Phd/YefM family antitoxin [Truepera sp.]